jgi:hypothetical protein
VNCEAHAKKHLKVIGGFCQACLGVKPHDEEIARQLLPQAHQFCAFATAAMPCEQCLVGVLLTNAILEIQLQSLQQTVSRIIFMAIYEETDDLLRTNLSHRSEIINN